MVSALFSARKDAVDNADSEDQSVEEMFLGSKSPKDKEKIHESLVRMGSRGTNVRSTVDSNEVETEKTNLAMRKSAKKANERAAISTRKSTKKANTKR